MAADDEVESLKVSAEMKQKARARFPWPDEWHDRVLDYAENVLGMELDGPLREPPEIVAIAYEALTAPLPQGWTMRTTPEGTPYYWYVSAPFVPLTG